MCTQILDPISCNFALSVSQGGDVSVMGWEWQEQLGCGHPAWWKISATGHSRGQALGTVHRRSIWSGGSLACKRCPCTQRSQAQGWVTPSPLQLYCGGSQHSRCSCWTDLRCSWGILVGDLCLRMCLFLPFHAFRGNSTFLNVSISPVCCCQPYEAWSSLRDHFSL